MSKTYRLVTTVLVTLIFLTTIFLCWLYAPCISYDPPTHKFSAQCWRHFICEGACGEDIRCYKNCDHPCCNDKYVNSAILILNVIWDAFHALIGKTADEIFIKITLFSITISSISIATSILIKVIVRPKVALSLPDSTTVKLVVLGTGFLAIALLGYYEVICRREVIISIGVVLGTIVGIKTCCKTAMSLSDSSPQSGKSDEGGAAKSSEKSGSKPRPTEATSYINSFILLIVVVLVIFILQRMSGMPISSDQIALIISISIGYALGVLSCYKF